MGWTVVALGTLGLRVAGAIVVGAARVPAWSGPLVEVLLWIGGSAILDPAALSTLTYWLGLIVLLLLWGPALTLAHRVRGPRRAVPIVASLLALAVQAAITQALVAGTISEATGGRVCQVPRKVVDVGGDLYPAPPGSEWRGCVLGRPGGGYVGD